MKNKIQFCSDYNYDEIIAEFSWEKHNIDIVVSYEKEIFYIEIYGAEGKKINVEELNDIIKNLKQSLSEYIGVEQTIT
ncbi:MAG: hypothetical protein ACRCUP_07610 [Mycoplasmatales bacterium]